MHGHLATVSVLSFMPRNGACLLANSPDIQQTDDTAEAGAQKQKGSVQQRRNLPHIHGKKTENKRARLSLMVAAGCL